MTGVGGKEKTTECYTELQKRGGKAFNGVGGAEGTENRGKKDVLLGPFSVTPRDLYKLS